MKNPSVISAVLRRNVFCNSIFRFICWSIAVFSNWGLCFLCRRVSISSKEKNDISKAKSMYETLTEAKEKNEEIYKMKSKIEDAELVKDIEEIYDTVKRIIDTIEKKPEKYKKSSNFFNYYLPVTMNILNKYDEIENQRLSSKDSQKFMESAKGMIQKINKAFKKQLSNLYQSEIIDTDAEMKVFDSMLKADGYSVDDNDFEEGKNE